MTTDARSYARTVQSRAAFDWTRFEAAAFSEHPALQDVISPGSDRDAGRPRTSTRSRDVPTWVAGIVLLLAQVEAFIQLIEGTGGRGPSVSPTEAVHHAGLMSTLSLVALVVLSALAYRRRRAGEVASAGTGAVVLLAVVAAGVNLVLLVLKGSRNGVDVWALWSVPSVLCVFLGIVLFTTDSGPTARGRTLLGRLSPAEAALLRGHIIEALDVLHSRRILRDDELERAKRVPLGRLHLSMMPLEESSPTRD